MKYLYILSLLLLSACVQLPLEDVQVTNGTNGIDGYTPIKGIDYFDGIDGTNAYNITNNITNNIVNNITNNITINISENISLTKITTNISNNNYGNDFYGNINGSFESSSLNLNTGIDASSSFCTYVRFDKELDFFCIGTNGINYNNTNYNAQTGNDKFIEAKQGDIHYDVLNISQAHEFYIGGGNITNRKLLINNTASYFISSINVSGIITGNGSGITSINVGNANAGTLAVARGGTGVTSSTGSGSTVLSNLATMNNLTIGTTGYIKLGNTSIMICNTTNVGRLTYNYTSNLLQYCNSTVWKNI